MPSRELKSGNQLFANSKRNDPKWRHSSLIEHGIYRCHPSVLDGLRYVHVTRMQTLSEVFDPYNAIISAVLHLRVCNLMQSIANSTLNISSFQCPTIGRSVRPQSQEKWPLVARAIYRRPCAFQVFEIGRWIQIGFRTPRMTLWRGWSSDASRPVAQEAVPVFSGFDHLEPTGVRGRWPLTFWSDVEAESIDSRVWSSYQRAPQLVEQSRCVNDDLCSSLRPHKILRQTSFFQLRSHSVE